MSSPYVRREVAPRPGPARWAGARAQPARPSAIDKMLAGFRHRWETDAAYRTRMSVIGGAGGLVGLCLLVGVVAVVASGTVGGSGAPSPASVAQSANGGQLQGSARFPTPSLPPWTPGVVPAAPVAPISETPVPGPTHVASPTPTDSGGGTPTTGGLPTTCNGNVGSTTWNISPCPQVAGQGGSISIHASGSHNQPINVLINFGVCAGNANCTYTFTPAQGYALDSYGNITIPYTVPSAAANNSAPVSGMVNIQNGPSFSFTAAPVQ
jgi:hypothetical protein